MAAVPPDASASPAKVTSLPAPAALSAKLAAAEAVLRLTVSLPTRPTKVAAL